MAEEPEIAWLAAAVDELGLESLLRPSHRRAGLLADKSSGRLDASALRDLDLAADAIDSQLRSGRTVADLDWRQIDAVAPQGARLWQRALNSARTIPDESGDEQPRHATLLSDVSKEGNDTLGSADTAPATIQPEPDRRRATLVPSTDETSGSGIPGDGADVGGAAPRAGDRRATLIAFGVLLLVGATTIALIGWSPWSGDDGPPGTTPSTTEPEGPAYEVTRTVEVVAAPWALSSIGSDVAVSSREGEGVAFIDGTTFAVSQFAIGDGATVPSADITGPVEQGDPSGSIAWAPHVGVVGTAEAGDELHRIDRAVGTTTAFEVGTEPLGLVVTENALIALTNTPPQAHFLSCIDASELSPPTGVGDSPRNPVLDGGFVWISGTGNGVLTRIDPVTFETAEVQGFEGPYPPRAADGRLFVPQHDADSVAVVDIESLQRLPDIPTAPNPVRPLLAEGLIWVAHDGGDTTTVIDPSTLEVVDSVALGTGARPHVSLGGLVWFTQGTRLLGVDPQTREISTTIDVGSRADWLIEHQGQLWVTLPDERSVAIIGSTNSEGQTTESTAARPCAEAS